MEANKAVGDICAVVCGSRVGLPSKYQRRIGKGGTNVGVNAKDMKLLGT